MKVEGVCNNIECPSVVNMGIKPWFRHFQLMPEDDALCACCHQELEVVTRVPDDHLFALGRIATTPGAREALDIDGLHRVITRHVLGDWSELDAHDRQLNMKAVKHDVPPNRGRILSAYSVTGQKLWVITEAGRHETTVLLPSEY